MNSNNVECNICYEESTKLKNMPCTTRNCDKHVCMECSFKIKDLRCPYCQSGYLDIPKGLLIRARGADADVSFNNRKKHVLIWANNILQLFLKSKSNEEFQGKDQDFLNILIAAVISQITLWKAYDREITHASKPESMVMLEKNMKVEGGFVFTIKTGEYVLKYTTDFTLYGIYPGLGMVRLC